MSQVWTRPPCPKCGRTEPVYKVKPEMGSGFFCWAKKGGCGHSWDPYLETPRVAEMVAPSESLGQAVQRVQSQENAKVVAQATLPPPAPVTPVLGPALGTVEVVTGSGNETFPPRTTWLVKDGHLQILNKEGAVIRLYNNAVWNQVRFNLP